MDKTSRIRSPAINGVNTIVLNVFFLRYDLISDGDFCKPL